jgi:hypothetical protein
MRQGQVDRISVHFSKTVWRGARPGDINPGANSYTRPLSSLPQGETNEDLIYCYLSFQGIKQLNVPADL